MHPTKDRELAIALSALGSLAVAAALVAVRGEVRPEAIALVLAVTVAISGRIGGRAAGIAAALMSATAFNFFHAEPYLSLKIDKPDDVLTTVLLLAVGLVVGGLSAQAVVKDASEANGVALSRVLAVAMAGDPGAVERSVCTEIVHLLHLRDCWFVDGPIDLPALAASGELPGTVYKYRDGGFELPEQGIAIPVEAPGRGFGHLICLPTPHTGVTMANRRASVALAEVLGLSLAATSAPA